MGILRFSGESENSFFATSTKGIMLLTWCVNDYDIELYVEKNPNEELVSIEKINLSELIDCGGATLEEAKKIFDELIEKHLA